MASFIYLLLSSVYKVAPLVNRHFTGNGILSIGLMLTALLGIKITLFANNTFANYADETVDFRR